MPKTESLDTTFDVLAACAGLTIPADRRSAIVAGYAEVKAMAELLRTMEIGPADEPANVYTFDPILRSA